MIPYSFIDWVDRRIRPDQPLDGSDEILRETLIELIRSVHELNTKIEQLTRRVENIEIVRRSPWTRG